jgi:hypothetical protein
VSRLQRLREFPLSVLRRRPNDIPVSRRLQRERVASDREQLLAVLLAILDGKRLARFVAVRPSESQPNQALQQTAGHSSFFVDHSSPVPRRC